MQEMVIIGANAAGLSNKTDSLLRLISVFNPGVHLDCGAGQTFGLKRPFYFQDFIQIL